MKGRWVVSLYLILPEPGVSCKPSRRAQLEQEIVAEFARIQQSQKLDRI
jgi:hypothetical protein